MRKSAIMQMFYGERGCHEDIKLTKEQTDILEDIISLYENIENKLKDNLELLDLFKNFDEKVNILNCVSCDKFYLEGFKFGVQIGIDVMT